MSSRGSTSTHTHTNAYINKYARSSCQFLCQHGRWFCKSFLKPPPFGCDGLFCLFPVGAWLPLVFDLIVLTFALVSPFNSPKLMRRKTKWEEKEIHYQREISKPLTFQHLCFCEVISVARRWLWGCHGGFSVCWATTNGFLPSATTKQQRNATFKVHGASCLDYGVPRKLIPAFASTISSSFCFSNNSPKMYTSEVFLGQ